MSNNPSTREDLASLARVAQEGTAGSPWPRGSKTICIPCDQEQYPELVANAVLPQVEQGEVGQGRQGLCPLGANAVIPKYERG